MHQPSDYDFDPRFTLLGFWAGICLICVGSLMALGWNLAGWGLCTAIVGVALALLMVKK